MGGPISTENQLRREESEFSLFERKKIEESIYPPNRLSSDKSKVMFFQAATFNSAPEGPAVQRKQGEFKVSEFPGSLFADTCENGKRERVPHLPFCGTFGRMSRQNISLEARL